MKIITRTKKCRYKGNLCKDYVEDSVVCNDDYEAIGYCPFHKRFENFKHDDWIEKMKGR